MNTNLKTRIAAIREECRMVLEQDKTATPGPWRATELGYVDNQAYDVACVVSGELLDEDTAFIATARTVCPAAARATLAAMDWLETAQQSALDAFLENTLTAICDAWEGRG